MFLIRKRPQPRGFCSPASFASISGDSISVACGPSPTSSDAHDELAAGRDHLDLDRDLGPALVAVLDRVHRGLGHGGLEPLDATGFEPERLDRVEDALHRLALVAGLAR